MAKNYKPKTPKATELPPQSQDVLTDGERRIRNVGQARELWTQLYLENQRRAEVYAQVRNQIEGGRPFDPETLRQNGEEWRTNVNFRDAEAAFNRAYLPYWKMVHEVPRKASFKIHSKAPDTPKNEVAMAEAFDQFLEDWGPDYFMQFQGCTRDYVKYGPGYVMWPDTSTPRFKWAQTVQIYHPKRTKTNVDDWELVCIKREMTACQLWEHCKPQAKEAAKYAGWNTAMVEKAIQLAAPNPSQNQFFDPNYYQDLIINNDLVIGGVWPPVSVIDLWAKGKDGKICHYIFTEKSDVADYLYENHEEAESFQQIFGSVFYDIGENGLIHSVKGFGVKNYYYATAINRTKCRLLDAATFSMGMNFVRDDGTPDESPPVENYSMVNIFPKGLNQLQYYPQLQAVQNVMGVLKQNQDENNYTYNDVSHSIGDTGTAKQAEILASIGQEMSTSVSTTYLAQVGRNVYSECVRRLRKKGSEDADAKKFVQRCKAAGVPEEVIFKSEITVTTGASPTMASPLVREQIANTLMSQIYPLPGANRRAIEEFRVSNLAGADGVDRFLLPEGSQSDPMSRRQALMENADFGQGISLPAAPEDAQVEHLDEHLKPLEAIVQAAKAGQQVGPDHLMAVQTTLPHIGEHLQFLSTDETRRPQFKELKARASNVESVMRGILARLQKQQMMAQQGQEVDPQSIASAIQGGKS